MNRNNIRFLRNKIPVNEMKKYMTLSKEYNLHKVIINQVLYHAKRIAGI